MPAPRRRRTRVLLAGTVLALVAAGAVPSAGALEPPLPPGTVLPAVTVTEEAVAAAQTAVQDMSQRVAAVSAELAEGTAAWEAGTAQLAEAQARAARAQARAEQAERQAQQRRRTLNGFVSTSYRSPQSAPLVLKAGGGATGLTEALRAAADLDRIRGNQQEALQQATAAGREAAQARAEADALRAEAAERERQLAEDLAGLHSLADRTNEQLLRALAEVDRLEQQRAQELAAREAARLAALEAARLAALEAARLAALEAARVAAEQAAAERSRTAAAAAAAAAAAEAAAEQARPQPTASAPGGSVSTSSAGGCSGRPTGGYPNGAIPASALCPLSHAGGHRLRADAAAAFNAMTEAARASRGAPLCITDSYRSYVDQVRVYREKPGLAAIPGTSNHGLGVAVDMCGGVQQFGTSAHEWMRANAGRFGWVHPSWAQAGGSKPEPWHWEYTG